MASTTIGSVTTEEVWTSSTIEAVLQEKFITTLQESVANKVDLLQAFEKGTVEWSGKRAVVPVHVTRNDGVGVAGENGSLPTAGSQGTTDLNISAAYVYGSFEISGPSEEAGRKGMSSLINTLEFEMTGLEKDLRNFSDRVMWSGGRCVGFLNEHKAGGAGATWDFNGDGTRLARLIVGDASLDVSLIRMDTYATVGAATTISANNIAGGTCVIDDARDTTVVAAGYATAVIVTSITGAAPGAASIPYEPLGVYSNLAEPTHFTALRTTAGGGFTTLQSNVKTVATSGAHDRTTLTAKRLHAMISDIKVASDEEPDELWSHENLRQEYYSLATGSANSISFDPKTGATKIDMGATDMKFSGKPWRTARQCGTGLIFFSNRDSWIVAELGKFKLANIDGKTLQRVANKDAVGGYMRWYYQLVCTAPNRNGILCGIDFSGAL